MLLAMLLIHVMQLTLRRCLGVLDSNCSTGYTGPLCVACDYSGGFVSNGSKKCGTCKSPMLSFSVVFDVIYGKHTLHNVLYKEHKIPHQCSYQT